MKISLIGADKFFENIIASAAAAENCDNALFCFADLSEYLKDEASVVSDAVFVYANGGYALREQCRKIRRKDDEVKIIVISESYACVGTSFEIKAYQYFCKDSISRDSVVHELVRIRRELAECEKYYAFRKKGYKITVNTGEVVYLETKNRYVNFYLTDGTNVYRRGKLDDMEEYFKKNGFVRIHKSFMANTKFVEKQTKSYLRMKFCDRELPVSRKYKQAVAERFAVIRKSEK